MFIHCTETDVSFVLFKYLSSPSALKTNIFKWDEGTNRVTILK